MSTTLSTAPAAGWYHDPADPGAWRWWDGSSWTDHVHPGTTALAAVPELPETAPQQVQPDPPAQQVQPDPPAQQVQPDPPAAPTAPAPAPEAPEAPAAPAPGMAGIPQPGEVAPAPPAPTGHVIARAVEIPVTDQAYWHSSAAETIHVPRLAHGSVHGPSNRGPGGRVPNYIRDWNDLGSPNTAGIWLLAASPLLSIPVALLIGLVFTLAGLAQFGTLVATGVMLGLAWIFAYLDQRALSERGYHAPSIWWMLLLPPLIYFIARGRAVRRENRRAWPPELLYVLTVLAFLVLAFLEAWATYVAVNGL